MIDKGFYYYLVPIIKPSAAGYISYEESKPETNVVVKREKVYVITDVE